LLDSFPVKDTPFQYISPCSRINYRSFEGMKTFSDSESDLLLQTKAILLFLSQYIDECCHQDTKFISLYNYGG
jgi:hypothetical protein